MFWSFEIYTYESYLDYRSIIDWNSPNTIVFQTSSNKCTDKLSANFSLLSVMIISYWLFMNKLYLNNYGSSHWKCSMKKAVLNTFTNSLEKTWPFESFFKKIKTVLERRLQHRCLLYVLQKSLLPKICHTYPAMMKLGTVILYLNTIQKSRYTLLEFCWQYFFTVNLELLSYH